MPSVKGRSLQSLFGTVPLVCCTFPNLVFDRIRTSLVIPISSSRVLQLLALTFFMSPFLVATSHGSQRLGWLRLKGEIVVVINIILRYKNLRTLACFVPTPHEVPSEAVGIVSLVDFDSSVEGRGG